MVRGFFLQRVKERPPKRKGRGFMGGTYREKQYNNSSWHGKKAERVLGNVYRTDFSGVCLCLYVAVVLKKSKKRNSPKYNFFLKKTGTVSTKFGDARLITVRAEERSLLACSGVLPDSTQHMLSFYLSLNSHHKCSTYFFHQFFKNREAVLEGI